MKKLDDVEIASAYKGKSFDEDRIITIADENGDDEYVAYCCEYDEEQLEMFGITPVLFEKWEISGLVFEVHIEVQGNTITDCFIFKYKETSCYGKSEGQELIPTQQEIRIFRRIMDFVTGIK